MFPSIIHLQKDDVFLNHHEENNNPIVSSDCFFDKQDLVSHYHHHHQKQQQQKQQQLHGLKSCDDYDNLLESVVYNSSSNKKAMSLKKDGHSKICTSKGPRDRRVRLSIEIARKFFELQDMLGYERPSQTIDWLFTKSKKAIAELIEETKHSSSHSSTVSTTNDCELALLGTIKGISDGKLKFLDGGNKQMARKDKCGFRVNFARDRLRAEARARARERTKEKLRVKGLDSDLIAKTVDGGSSFYALQSNLGGQVESQSDYDDIFQQLKLEHRFSVSSSMWHPYQRSLVASDNSSSGISYKGLPN